MPGLESNIAKPSAAQDQPEAKEPVRPQDGEVYLQRKVVTLGIHDTAKQSVLENYFLCRIHPDGRVEVILLDLYDNPSELSEIVDLEEFSERFVHQPGYLQERPSFKERMKQKLVNRICDIADGHFKSEEFLSAEYEYKRALKLDVDSVRANFGLGMTYMSQGDTSHAHEVFVKLANLDAVYEAQHKHLFNTFGIQLRKLGLYHEALEHYNRALHIVQDDEHLWFNLARCVHEDGNDRAAKKMMVKALEINPLLKEAEYYLQNYLQADVPTRIRQKAEELRQHRSHLDLDVSKR